MVRIILGTASFMLMSTLCGPLNAQAKAPAAPKGEWKQPIIGVGENEESAKRDALREVATIVAGIMKKVDPPLRYFKVDDDFVQKHLLANAGKPGQDGEELNLAKLKEPVKIKQWIVTLRPYADWWQELLQHERAEEIKVRAEERKARAEERQTLTSRVMLGLSLLLLAGVGYVRLDEYTNRRHTRLLRFAGLGIASAVAALWWVFIQAPG